MRCFLVALLALVSVIGLAARAAEPPLDLPAARLLPLADPHGGSASLVTPPPENFQNRKAEVLLFKPVPDDPTLTLRVPVSEDGFYRVQTRLVFGPWREGRYGMYRAKADGVELDGYYHGWYGRGPGYTLGIQEKNWGAIFLRKPSVEVSFHLDTKQAGDLLAIERVRIEPADPAKLSDRERVRRVPERAEPEQAAAWPVCLLDAEQALGWVTPVAAPPKPVTVDGDLAEWDFAHPLIAINSESIKGRGYGAPPPESDSDLSVVAQLAWDEAHLYLAAHVRDNERAEKQPGAPWSSFWSHDGLVLSLAGKGEATPFQELTVGFNYYPPGSSPRELPKGVRYAAKSTKDGYDLEAVVPFAAVGLVPRAGDRLRFMLIAVDIDPSAPPGRQFKQYLWNTRMGDPLRWGEMRLIGSEGWGADLTPEREAYAGGDSIRYIGVADNFSKAAVPLSAIEVVDRSKGQIVHRQPIILTLPAERRSRLRGELVLPLLPHAVYELRLSAP